MSDRVTRLITGIQAQELDWIDLERARERRKRELEAINAQEAERFRGLGEPLRFDPEDLAALEDE